MSAFADELPSTHLSLLQNMREVDNHDAWSLFVETYTPLLMRYCRRWGLQDADARDVTQTVFGIVTRSIGSFEYDPSRGKFRSWLGAIARHEIRRHQNQSDRGGRGAGGESALLDLQTQELESDWMDDFNARIYECAVERIKPSFEPETWQAFELTWIDQQKPSEAGLTLGKPAAWISRAKYRVLKRLWEEIEFLASDVAVLAGRQELHHRM